MSSQSCFLVPQIIISMPTVFMDLIVNILLIKTSKNILRLTFKNNFRCRFNYSQDSTGPLQKRSRDFEIPKERYANILPYFSYNYSAEVGKAMDLDVTADPKVWRGKAIQALEEAILYSFQVFLVHQNKTWKLRSRDRETIRYFSFG